MLFCFQFLIKVQRQERAVEEIKMVLKPHYNRKKIDKDAYKEILRKCVPKVITNAYIEILRKCVTNVKDKSKIPRNCFLKVEKLEKDLSEEFFKKN
jgi:hypothetical protein